MNRKLWELFSTFFKIGAFTFGGGYAMIPLVQHEIVEQKAYITETEFTNLLAIAEATPGVIAVNTATFVGYKVSGILGGILSTCGVVLPSFIIITLISLFYDAFRSIQWVDWAFSGIRAGVLVLIVGAFVKMFKKCDKKVIVYLLMISAFALATFTPIKVALIILAGAAMGILRQVIIGKKRGRGHEHLS